MIIGHVFFGAITGMLAAGVGMILFDLSFLWAAIAYSVVGTFGMTACAGICLLLESNQLETPAPSTDKLDHALSGIWKGWGGGSSALF